MKFKFTKMQGCGNDYIYVNGFTEKIPQEEKTELVRHISDRHFGIGGDGVIFINPSSEADFEMEMYNADGSRAEMCGNGIRCVAKFVYDKGLTEAEHITVLSAGRIKYLSMVIHRQHPWDRGIVKKVRVNMGSPIFEPEQIPVKTEYIRSAGEGETKDQIVNEPIEVNGKEYSTVRLLGKGKGGYSYLASDGQREYVLKQIHHEPCDYYQFGNKMEAEMNDYRRLKEAGIRMPELLEADIREERILKEYIEGKTIYELVRLDEMKPEYLSQVRQMCERLYAVGLNIDYFPTNFVVQEKELHYIDYECNEYMEKWNFENWGIRYWSKTEEFLQYVRKHE